MLYFLVLSLLSMLSISVITTTSEYLGSSYRYNVSIIDQFEKVYSMRLTLAMSIHKLRTIISHTH